ncbi:hypothetical protein [Dyadobacter fanqingshengii]|uniref:Uncharacterized protein n=1 Tax=Dyadobacter fanqingshengii TaxID=2906443 RepID=A0A9X1P8K1_9BACT|nr:hypothetical protein [Dyadobacter fanqingshengii]MCF0040015.1 hypothetical protein [Dyadobacter fanqingshengii]MCF2502474.1 hypothetical protein [Dyadobacter fanqingshengii]USJ38233.1 hypothetical protein NFI81_10690 [Dyadobacter fanqingshengii]
MKLQGIKTEYTQKGKVKKVIINAASKSELVEDLLDMIALEAVKNDERIPFDEVVAKLDKKHKIKR